MLCFRIDLVHMLMSLVQAFQNEDSVENTLGTTNCSFSLFFTNNYFVLKAVLTSLPRLPRCTS